MTPRMDKFRIDQLKPFPDVSDEMPLVAEDLEHLKFTWGDIRELADLASVGLAYQDAVAQAYATDPPKCRCIGWYKDPNCPQGGNHQ